MRMVIAAGALLTAALWSDGARADPYRWCAHNVGSPGSTSCWHETLEQCRQATLGAGACTLNPFYTGPDPAPPGSGAPAVVHAADEGAWCSREDIGGGSVVERCHFETFEECRKMGPPVTFCTQNSRYVAPRPEPQRTISQEPPAAAPRRR